MLLESRIDDRLTLVVDCESVGSIDKGALTVRSHPDQILGSTVTAIRAIATQLGAAATLDRGTPPSAMEVRFGVRVDSNAVVSLARAPEAAQFQVTLRWDAPPTR
jgi:hypothetical protein